jgi:proton glutamate symport protein
MAVKGLVYFEAVTTFAFLIGIAVVNILKPGVGIDSSKAVGAGQIEHIKHSASDIILNAFPENIAKAVAEGQILQVVIFSVIFAIAISMLSQEKRAPMFNVVKSLSEIMFKVTKIVMYFAPLGVCGSVAYIVGHEGLGVVLEMLKLLAALYTAMIAFVILVLLPVGLIAGVPIRRFVRAAIEPVTIAFATTNSEAAMPDAMQKMRSIGVPEEVVSFIFPLGYSFNLDGSSLYLSLATVFVAQAAGIQMSLTQQMIMVFTLMLTSKGVAGVSRGAFVILSAMVMDLNLPVEPLLLILGIDHFMDMARTAVNVLGNCLATVVIARWEGVYDKDQA